MRFVGEERKTNKYIDVVFVAISDANKFHFRWDEYMDYGWSVGFQLELFYATVLEVFNLINFTDHGTSGQT